MSAPRLLIQLEGDNDLPWDYFLLQAARGGVRVPDWVLFALPPAVGAALGRLPSDVTDDDLERAFEQLPRDPTWLLHRLMKPLELQVPNPGEVGLVLAESQARGSFREAVGMPDLLHDAALVLQLDYGRAGFAACMEAIEDPSDWDARAAVAAMVYLLLLRSS